MDRKVTVIYPNEWYETLQHTWSYGKNLVGFCHYHHRFVTKKQAKLHRCFEKKCRRLEWIK